MVGRPTFLALCSLLLLTLGSSPALSDSTSITVSDGSVLWEAFHPSWRPEAGYSDLRAIAQDPEGRLEPDFRIPPSLVDRVLFWATVYSQATSRMRIVHDRDDPRLLYGYLDFNPLYQTLSPANAESRVSRIERDVKTNLALALNELGNQGTLTPLNALDRALFRQFLAQRQRATSETIRALAYNIRTQSGQSDIFQTALERSGPLLPKMEEVFRREGLPKSLAKIPFVESSFNPRALSKVGAVGLWQFMPATAKAFIHKHHRHLWSDPILQTQAAAKLLKGYRKSLPDWGSTVTSYNSGIGRVAKIYRTRDLSNITDLVALREEEGGLRFAGRNFYAELLAANLVEAYKTELFSPRALPKNSLASLPRSLSFLPDSKSCRMPPPPANSRGSAMGNYNPTPNQELRPTTAGTDSWVEQKVKETSSWIGNAFREIGRKSAD